MTATIPTLWAVIIRHASATVVSRWSMKRKPWRMMWRSVFMAHLQGVRVAGDFREWGDRTIERAGAAGPDARPTRAAPPGSTRLLDSPPAILQRGAHAADRARSRSQSHSCAARRRSAGV